jgi:hypothetical protein
MGNRHTRSANHEIQNEVKFQSRKSTKDNTNSLKLQYTITLTQFTNLSNIDISSSKISNIEFIPFGVVQFNCRNNMLQTLPKLPYTLEILDCCNNRLTGTLELPDNLKIVRCYNNMINNIVTIKVIDNLICDINVCPDDLIELNCHTNRFTELPKINDRLEYLFCENTELKLLPYLPKTLKYNDFTIVKMNYSYEIEWSGLMISVNEKDIEQMNSYIKKMNKHI